MTPRPTRHPLTNLTPHTTLATTPPRPRDAVTHTTDDTHDRQSHHCRFPHSGEPGGRDHHPTWPPGWPDGAGSSDVGPGHPRPRPGGQEKARDRNPGIRDREPGPVEATRDSADQFGGGKNPLRVGLSEDMEDGAGEAVGRDGTANSEDLKGLSGNDEYREAEKNVDGGGQSQRVTRRERGTGGRFIPGDESTRFWAKVTKQPGGCWLWTGAVSHDGYGRFRITTRPGRHRHVKAHRWAYQHLVGPIPAGWTLDHLTDQGCTTTACVRPDHLEPVTRADNARRAAARRRRHQEAGDHD